MIDSKMIFEQNRVIISLLGRLCFSEDELKKIITTNSNKPELLIKAYNLCDGTLSIQQIAGKITGITVRSLAIAMKKWEKKGILVNLGKRTHRKGNLCKHLYKIKEEIKESEKNKLKILKE